MTDPTAAQPTDEARALVDVAIEAWHDSGRPLHEWLGWTEAEYAAWVADADAIPRAPKHYAAFANDRPRIGEAARHELCLLIERMCPDKPDSNFGHPVGSQVETLADAILALHPHNPVETEGVKAQGGFRCHHCKMENYGQSRAPARCNGCGCRDFSAFPGSTPVPDGKLGEAMDWLAECDNLVVAASVTSDEWEVRRASGLLRGSGPTPAAAIISAYLASRTDATSMSEGVE